MDLLTHTLLARKLVGRKTTVLLVGVGPDVPWCLTYPGWVIAQGKAVHALTTGEWPDPPRWMKTLHHASHSLTVTCASAALICALTGRWPGRELAAWVLHILVDIPSHSRRFWAPRFLWPLSDVAVNGVPWAEITSNLLASVLRRALIWFTG
jgi:hypothetical protein